MSEARFADPGLLSDQEPRDLIDRFAAREHVVSYERRVLHGRSAALTEYAAVVLWAAFAQYGY